MASTAREGPGVGPRHPLVDAYVGALAGLGAVLQAVGDDEWDLPTPCPEWDVRALVAHVVLGELQLAEVGSGVGAGSVEADASILGRYPLGVWRGTALAAISTASEPGFVERSFDGPTGMVSASALLTVRSSENLIHGWDLARAIGQPYSPSPGLVALVEELWSDPDTYRVAPTGFGPPLVPESIDAWTRLLARLGRRP